jgi:hypothetical protein
MTNRIACIAAVLCLATAASLPAQGPGTIGATVGINFSSVTGSDDDPSTRTGFRAGLYTILDLKGNLFWQPEVAFTSKGADFGSAELVINYIQIPVLLRSTFPGESMSLYVLSGPAIAFKIGCDINPDVGSSVDCGPSTTDVKSTDFSLMLGAGAQFGQIGVDLRYDLGLTNINNDGVNDVKSSAFTVSVAYAFARR